jgi:hypothetical protein
MRGSAAVWREGRMIGQRMRREQVGFEGRWHQGTAVLGGLNPQKAPCLTEIHKIDGGSQPGRESAAHVEE